MGFNFLMYLLWICGLKFVEGGNGTQLLAQGLREHLWT